MAQNNGKFFTKGNTKIEELPRGKHFRFSRPDITDSEKLMVTKVDMKPQKGHSFHRHPRMDEVIYVIDGKAEQWIGQERQILHPGEAAFIPENTIHAIFNCGNEILSFLAIISPAGDLYGSDMIDVSEEEPWCNLRNNT
jgi:quercetin dioxygenase-like cupin family protein